MLLPKITWLQALKGNSGSINISYFLYVLYVQTSVYARLLLTNHLVHIFACVNNHLQKGFGPVFASKARKLLKVFDMTDKVLKCHKRLICTLTRKKSCEGQGHTMQCRAVGAGEVAGAGGWQFSADLLTLSQTGVADYGHATFHSGRIYQQTPIFNSQLSQGLIKYIFLV